MPDTNPGKALYVVQSVAWLKDFISHPAIREAVTTRVPVTMPPAIGAFGFEEAFWSGLGTVSLWAALDAFAERAELPDSTRCATCGRRSCVAQRFSSHVQGTEGEALSELEDLRHLYAHNYAGKVDAEYARYPRHALVWGRPVQLTVGATFDGENVRLDSVHLRAYADVAKAVLQRFS